MGQGSLYRAEAAIEKTAPEVLHSASRIISKHTTLEQLARTVDRGRVGLQESAEDRVRLSAVELSKVKGVSARPAKEEVKEWHQIPERKRKQAMAACGWTADKNSFSGARMTLLRVQKGFRKDTELSTAVGDELV